MRATGGSRCDFMFVRMYLSAGRRFDGRLWRSPLLGISGAQTAAGRRARVPVRLSLASACRIWRCRVAIVICHHRSTPSVIAVVTGEKFVVGLSFARCRRIAQHASRGRIAFPVKAAPASATATASDWTGFYLGAHLGYAFGSSHWTATGAAGPPIPGSLDLFNSFDAFKGTGSYLARLQAGYNFMLRRRGFCRRRGRHFFPNILGQRPNPGLGRGRHGELISIRSSFPAPCAAASVTRRANWLFYATGGFAYSYDRFTRTQIAGTPAGGTAVAGHGRERSSAPRAGVAARGRRRTVRCPRIGRRGSNICSPITAAAASPFPRGRAASTPISPRQLRLRPGLPLQRRQCRLLRQKAHAAGARVADNFAIHGQTTFARAICAAVPFAL